MCAPPGELRKADAYAAYILQCGAAPVAPHFYARLPGADAALCARAADSLLWMCDEVWVFGGYVTRDMRRFIHRARLLYLRVRFIDHGGVD